MKNGFTIIELIIAIFVLSIAVIGVFGAFSIMVILTSSTADRLTAAYLAQEGVEVIRNIRDSNWLNMSGSDTGAKWDDNFDSCKEPLACEVDYTTTGSVLNPVRPWQENSYLKTDADNLFYSYGDGTETKFRRKITITPIADNNGDTYVLKVSVKVFWKEKPSILNPDGNDGSIEAKDTLYNWY